MDDSTYTVFVLDESDNNNNNNNKHPATPAVKRLYYTSQTLATHPSVKRKNRPSNKNAGPCFSNDDGVIVVPFHACPGAARPPKKPSAASLPHGNNNTSAKRSGNKWSRMS